jgi:hypothetical protein
LVPPGFPFHHFGGEGGRGIHQKDFWWTKGEKDFVPRGNLMVCKIRIIFRPPKRFLVERVQYFFRELDGVFLRRRASKNPFFFS